MDIGIFGLEQPPVPPGRGWCSRVNKEWNEKPRQLSSLVESQGPKQVLKKGKYDGRWTKCLGDTL